MPATDEDIDVLDEAQLRDMIQKGLDSGKPVPVDDAFLERLRSRIGHS